MNTTDPRKDDQLAKRVLTRIADEHLSPRPRWEFLFKNYFFWVLGVLAVALGALAVAASLFEVENVDWRLSAATHSNFIEFFLAAAPFFWVIALALLMLIGYANIRSTNHGYRYPLLALALGAVLTSLVLGGGLYALGFGGTVEEALGDQPPFYRPTIATQRSWWLAPEKGLLGGQIIQTASSSASFVLRDFNSRDWKVDGSDLPASDLSAVANGGTVRVVGTPSSATSSAFHACFVFPWKTRGKGSDAFLSKSSVTLAPKSERKELNERTDRCEGIRPYQQLRTIDENGL